MRLCLLQAAVFGTFAGIVHAVSLPFPTAPSGVVLLEEVATIKQHTDTSSSEDPPQEDLEGTMLKDLAKKPASPCPYDLAKLPDHPHCKREWCEPSSEHYANAVKFCKQMCNPNCDPSKAIRRDYQHGGHGGDKGLGNNQYVPTVNMVAVPGHVHCAERYTVQTKHGDRKNRATGTAVDVNVCAKCIDDNYMLRPAYSHNGMMLGVCEPLIEHQFWYRAMKVCQDPKHPIRTELADPYHECQSYTGDYGAHEVGAEYPKIGGYTNHGGYTYPDHREPPVDAATAFTCGRVYVNQPMGTPLVDNNEVIQGLMYNIVQASISSCYTPKEKTGDSASPEMKCVQRKILHSCHKKLLKPTNPKSAELKSLEAQRKQHTYKWEGEKAEALQDLKKKGAAGSGWKECTQREQRMWTSV